LPEKSFHDSPWRLQKMMNVATHASQSDACAGCKTARIHNQPARARASVHKRAPAKLKASTNTKARSPSAAGQKKLATTSGSDGEWEEF
jgi:hypothetical protein